MNYVIYWSHLYLYLYSTCGSHFDTKTSSSGGSLVKLAKQSYNIAPCWIDNKTMTHSKIQLRQTTLIKIGTGSARSKHHQKQVQVERVSYFHVRLCVFFPLSQGNKPVVNYTTYLFLEMFRKQQTQTKTLNLHNISSSIVARNIRVATLLFFCFI